MPRCSNDEANTVRDSLPNGDSTALINHAAMPQLHEKAYEDTGGG
jgi:hypothetical protein